MSLKGPDDTDRDLSSAVVPYPTYNLRVLFAKVERSNPALAASLRRTNIECITITGVGHCSWFGEGPACVSLSRKGYKE